MENPIIKTEAQETEGFTYRHYLRLQGYTAEQADRYIAYEEELKMERMKRKETNNGKFTTD